MKKILQNIVLAGILISVPPLFPSTVNSPKTLSNWIYNNFTYQREAPGEDYWKSPKETIRDKGGDCDDLAILTQYVLKKLGYKAYVIVIEYYNMDEMHAICIFKHKDGTFSYYSNEFYNPIRYRYVSELLSAHSTNVYLKWKKAWVVVSKSIGLGLPLWRNKI